MLSLKFNFTRIFTSIAIASIAIFIFLQIFTPVQAATGINRQINFQGKLVNNPAATNVTDTNYAIVFTLYDNTSGGTVLWTETQPSVPTVDGIFRVALGSVTPFPTNFNFNWSGLYLGIKVNSDAEMTPRVQMAAVPFAFNAEKVSGLTVQDTSGNASTSGTLQVANGVTVKLPVSGTGLIYADSASTGTLATLSNSTTQTGNVVGQAITLAGATGSLNQTGLQFNLSGVTSGTVLDIQGTGNSWYVTRNGALTVASCSGCGGAGSVNYWGLNNGNGTTNGGLLYAGNTTADLAVGGTSTSSALFSFSGVLTGNTIASASGNLILMPNNGWGGQLGIGTTTPGYNLDLSNTFHMFSLASPTLKNLTVDLTKEYQTNNTPNITLQTYAPSIYFKDSTPSSVGFTEFVDLDRFMIRKETGAYSNTDAFFSISSTGAVGIGTISPLASLDVRPNITNGGTIAIASVSGKTSYAALVVDNAGNSGQGDIFTASASGATRFVIAQNGTVTIGNSTDGLVFNPTAGTNPVVYSGNARPSKTITLSPEYAGAVLTASGSATTGSMTSDASPSALFRTYYEWSSTQASLQDYTIAVRITIPQDWSAWDSTSAITIDFNTATTNAPQNKFDFLLFNSNDANPTTPVVMRTANVSSVAKTWQTLTIPASALTGGTAKWQTAGDTATIYLKMYAGSPAYVQVGDIDFKYLSKF